MWRFFFLILVQLECQTIKPHHTRHRNVISEEAYSAAGLASSAGAASAAAPSLGASDAASAAGSASEEVHRVYAYVSG